MQKSFSGFKPEDFYFMKKALSLAKKGVGKTYPNPPVGAVLVKNKRIISTGWHKKAGLPHAEAEAIEKAGSAAREATLYVTLEPCVHYGKTPPCVLKIIEAGIKKVIIGTKDPNPVVNGKGIDALIKAGIEVRVGCLEEKAKELIKPFEKWIKSKTPFVTAKLATTLNGLVSPQKPGKFYITAEKARRFVHLLRSRVSAIVTGVGTVLWDDPLLDCRMVKKKPPDLIVFDSKLRTPPNAKIFNGDRKIYIFCSERHFTKKNYPSNTEIIPLKGERPNPLDVLKIVGEKNYVHLLLESGPKLLESFFEKKLVDEFLLFISPKIWQAGLHWKAQASLKIKKTKLIGDDLLVIMDKP